MKNIKFLSIIFVLLASCQLTFAQSAENNGRDLDAQPGTVIEAPTPTTNTVVNVEDDRDAPTGEVTEEALDYFYPVDIDIINEDLSNSIHPVELVERINELSNLVKSLKADYEELKLENSVIRQSFSNCCSSADLGLGAKDAYILQNAPNPFVETSEIKYFVPAGLKNVRMEVRDLKGELIVSIPIEESGYGKVNVGNSDKAISAGTYIYSLSVDGQMIDSNVMLKISKD